MNSSEPQRRREPVAVIGMGCRMPGADNIDAFWKLLCDGVDAVSTVPASRWDADALWSDDAGVPGRTYCRSGGYIPDGDCFDAEFFGISATEAASMDPQQGMVLEVAWHALEHAGIPADILRGSDTGVFVGIGNSDFDRRICGDLTNLTLHAGTGTSYSIAANRLSYSLGLCGPSIAVDLACSSSLVAIHLACQSLALRECDLALAGGVHLILSPEKTVTFSRGRVLSRSGRCKSFAHDADGYVRGEGCGIVVLKRLDDAVRDRDCVAAIIRGSAINHNGASNGLSAPLGTAQERVIRSALTCGDVDGATIDFVEAHSPGTLLGDVIEVRALMRVLGEGRRAGDRCVLGSVKSNIGHLEAAAGVAGVIKTILAMEHRRIPATLHVDKLNDKLPFADSTFSVAQRPESWETVDRPRRAGVSSFSFGGANAHVVVEESRKAHRSRNGAPTLQVLPISARDETSLRHSIDRYVRFCEEASVGDDSEGVFADLCYTAACGRAHLNHRIAVVAGRAHEAARLLKEFLQRGSAIGVWSKGSTIVRAPSIEFIVEGGATMESPPRWSPTLAAAYSQLRALATRLFDSVAVVDSFAVWSLLRYCGLQPVRVVAGPHKQALAKALVDPQIGRSVCEVLADRPDYWERSPLLAEGTNDEAGVRDSRRLAIGFGDPRSEVDVWLLASLSSAFVAGVPVRWGSILDSQCRKLRLPLHPFHRKRYWHESIGIDRAANHDPESRAASPESRPSIRREINREMNNHVESEVCSPPS